MTLDPAAMAERPVSGVKVKAVAWFRNTLRKVLKDGGRPGRTRSERRSAAREKPSLSRVASVLSCWCAFTKA
jgi:hypothetical protein